MFCLIFPPPLFLYNLIQCHVQEPQVFIRISRPLRSDRRVFFCIQHLWSDQYLPFTWVMSPRSLKAILQHGARGILILQFLNSMKMKVLELNLCLKLCFKLFFFIVFCCCCLKVRSKEEGMPVPWYFSVWFIKNESKFCIWNTKLRPVESETDARKDWCSCRVSKKSLLLWRVRHET